MASLNRVELIGRLGSAPEARTTSGGKQLVRVNLATDRRGGATDWHTLVFWEQLAGIVAQYATKGTRLYVAGRLLSRAWDDREGNRHITAEVVVNELILLDGPRAGTEVAASDTADDEAAQE